MGEPGGSRRLPAVTRVLAVVMLSLPGSHAAETAGISGVVVSAGDQAPLAGVKVHAVDPATGEIFSSAPTGNDGGFALDNLPASTYEFAVESSGGLYVVATPLALEPGETKALNLAVAKAAPASESATPRPPRGTPGIWDNPKLAALIVIGLAIVVGFAVDEITDPGPPVSSPVQP